MPDPSLRLSLRSRLTASRWSSRLTSAAPVWICTATSQPGPGGEVYVTGMAMALDFPVTDQSVSASSGPKAYLAKFNSNGTLAFSRLFGGGATTAGTGIAVDGSGNIYLAGATSSPNFPAKNAFQSLSMKDPVLSSILGLRSAFAAKFASDGKTLVYATLVGGTGDDAATAAAEDGQGNLYLAGSTGSTDLPVLNAVQEGLAGAQNGFVAELNPQGNALVFLTYLGGSQKDTAQNLALGSQGSIYVGGSATSADFPVLNGTDTTKSKATTNARSAFAVKFAPGGRGIIFSTLLGGSKDDAGNGIAADSAGAAYLAGTTASADFPLTGAFQASFGGQWDMFLAKVVPDSASASPIVALPASVGFTMISGGATPAAQGIDVALAGTGVSGAFTTTASTASGGNWLSITPAASTASGGNWLSITPAAGSVPGQIAVSVQPAGIGVGLYGGMIQIAPASGLGAGDVSRGSTHAGAHLGDARRVWRRELRRAESSTGGADCNAYHLRNRICDWRHGVGERVHTWVHGVVSHYLRRFEDPATQPSRERNARSLESDGLQSGHAAVERAESSGRAADHRRRECHGNGGARERSCHRRNQPRRTGALRRSGRRTAGDDARQHAGVLRWRAGSTHFDVLLPGACGGPGQCRGRGLDQDRGEILRPELLRADGAHGRKLAASRPAGPRHLGRAQSEWADQFSHQPHYCWRTGHPGNRQ
ncbi:hypothetical protein SBA3_1550016 [Candidatus Sulfopaludibacter sp. SbA3]|nr:hypothetical protein SBA3_1550016 [Candidatus Sulfopaludibacter sp. SbA3]